MISQHFTSDCAALTTSVASVLMTRFLLNLLQKAARNTRADVDVTTAARVATYPVAVRTLAWSLLGLGVAGAVLIACYHATRHAPLQGTLIGAAIISGPATVVAEFTRVRVEWTDTGLSFASPWSAPRRLFWEEIVEVTYSQTAGWFVVRGRNGAKIRLPQLLGGLGELFDEMKMRGSDEVRVQIEGVTERRTAR